MFERIVLAVDGSAQSGKAAVVASELAVGTGGEVLVLHVSEHATGRGMAFSVETPAEAVELVDGVVRELKDRGIGARGEVREALRGHTPRVIVDAAEEFDADIVVMGSRGLTDLSGLIMGSVTHKVLHLSHCPVLVVR